MSRLGAALLSLALISGGGAVAQVSGYPVADPFANTAVLIVDQERILTGSLLGRDMLARNKAESDALRQEGTRLDTAFEAEERDLTERRPDLTPSEFRELADAFDEKVVRTRAAQQEKSNALAARVENRRIDFFQQVAPILAGILSRTGAAAIIDERTVLISNEDLNITAEVIKRLDAAFLAAQPGDSETEEQGN